MRDVERQKVHLAKEEGPLHKRLPIENSLSSPFGGAGKRELNVDDRPD
jgi:hypothetical protein